MSVVVDIPKAEPEPGPFACGDVVQLNSGGAKMTVRDVTRTRTGIIVTAEYMDAADALFTVKFDARQLRLSEAAKTDE